ncbi:MULTISPECIES: iron chaperone [unclassified Paenibacillus]|uniref:iron chaperone n=1 Tax=unclassified Paenibacillus TaxID=185978 RepID=UPI00096F81F9|nr:iron chaperone [Paenibacillus sp. FSL H8-0259]OMF30177.1 iron chaperone [Paenibacillus sp. FSL H8-0259]
MEEFAEYLAKIDNPVHRAATEEVLAWVIQEFPQLTPKIAWNQPMFTDHGTYIIGFSVSKAHIAVAPEKAGMDHFADAIKQAGLDHTKLLVRMKWTSPVDYTILRQMIEYNIADKADCTTFWRA